MVFEEDILITIEGYYFITHDGGYSTQREASESVLILKDSRDRRLSNGTVYLAILTGALVLSEILIHWVDFLKTLCSWATWFYLNLLF